MAMIFLNRVRVVLAHDMVMAGLSFVMALYLRLGEGFLAQWGLANLLLWAGVMAGVAGLVFGTLGTSKGIWRYASVEELVNVAKAGTLTILVFFSLAFLATRLQDIPRSTMIINWFVMMTFIGGPRFIYRVARDRLRRKTAAAQSHRQMPVLLVGTGDDVALFIRALRRPDADYLPVGILNLKRKGGDILGVHVLGGPEELAVVLRRLNKAGIHPQKLIVTDPHPSPALLAQLVEDGERCGLSIARVPALTALQDGTTDKPEVRAVAVEDLLGRPQTVFDRHAVAAMVAGQVVVVTGAGGSIGAELVRQVADLGPSKLVLFEASEFNLYTIDMELAERWPTVQRRAVLGNIRDVARVDAVLAEERPAVLFHAAALKHVPMVEHNVSEGVMTNAVGTRLVAQACQRHGVGVMVQISTDKAVNPTNIMGASKRIAEMVTQAFDVAGGATIFTTVRFGNVLGSTGSVVPLFQRQLAAGGPITVTHPEMTRYFMTVREAVELTLQASALSLSDARHRGQIFVLDMGEPVKIVDLARQMIRLAGLRVDDDIAIVYTGLRPGEKLFEEIFHATEPPVATPHAGILLATPRVQEAAALSAALDRLAEACARHDDPAVISQVRALVPEYNPV